MKMILRTKIVALRIVIFLVLVMCVLQAAYGALVAVESSALTGAVRALIFIALGTGLGLQKAWARTAAVLVLWLTVIALSLAALSIVYEITAVKVPGWVSVGAVPLIAVALYSIYILGKFKSEFSRHQIAA